MVTLDTLYLNVKYPKSDLFDRWNDQVKDVDSRRLREGVVSGDYVIRTGASGYKLSVWSHDIRAYLTDDVDEKRGEGKGMGIWLQIGPKFLIDHKLNSGLKNKVEEFIFGIGVKGNWPKLVRRLDLAIDLLGVSIGGQSIDLWKSGWVGRSGVSSTYFNNESGDIETINIGSRRSAVFLRVYDKVAQAIKEGDLKYWIDIWGGLLHPVTRVEWQVSPKRGGFRELEQFDELCEAHLSELLVYLIEWGRLCIPNPKDTNNRRWILDPFWRQVQGEAKEWADAITWPISRFGKEHKEITEEYIKYVAGILAGAMARISPEDPSLINLLDGMEEYGQGLADVYKKAVEKAEIYSRL